MGILEGIVITAFVLAGSYVGYNVWQDSLNVNEGIEPHLIDFEFVHYTSKIIEAKSYSQTLLPIRFF